MPQDLIPIATDSSTSCTAVGAATLHECADESVDSPDDDTTYIRIDSLGNCILSLTTKQDPNGFDTIIRVRHRVFNGLTDPMTLRAVLLEGATVRATVDWNVSLGGSWITDQYTLTEAEARSIVDYSALKMQLADVFPPGGASHRVSAVALRVPERGLRATVTS